jgi:hypothetical protein
MNSIISPSLENKPAVVNGPKVGDILVSCWGYEASIASFAKVVAVTAKSVKIARLRAIENHTGPMEWTSTPDLGSVGKIETKRFSPSGDSYRVKDSSFSNYYPWGGKPVNCYNYH